MRSEIKTFVVPDNDGEEDQARLAAFLRTVEVERIDTAYAEGAWRVLVLYKDLKGKEEAAQIETAIAGALIVWRSRAAEARGMDREEFLPERLVNEIAHFAPTTAIELRTIANSQGLDLSAIAQDVVQVVRQTLEDLVD